MALSPAGENNFQIFNSHVNVVLGWTARTDCFKSWRTKSDH